MSGTTFSPKLYIPVFSLTLFLSAFLLFSIQPLFGKMVLPLLGGAPMVWNTAMLFYQAVLLGGYAYAHIMAKFLNIRTQAIVHIVLFSVFAFVLPFVLEEGIEPPIEPGQLVPWQIALMAVTIGGPFFVLSGCAPMLQHWFSKSGHEDSGNPYFLYAASNAGSMIALLSYPFVFEPTLTVPDQSAGWAMGYYVLIGMLVIAALLVWRKNAVKKGDQAKTATQIAAEQAEKPLLKTKLTWMFLAFIPSSLMLGVTTHISTDLAAFPLLWVIPLALFVSTFIIVFAKREIISLEKITQFHLIFFIALIFTFIGDVISSKPALIILHFIVFFLSALLCHKHLERLKPSSEHLTEFFFLMSLGGVCGGIFNALLAPVLFMLPIEYGLVLALATFTRYMDKDNQSLAHFKSQIMAKSAYIPFALILFFLVCAEFAYRNQYVSVLILGLFGICMMMTFIEKQRWMFAIASMVILLASQNNFKNNLGDLLHLDRNFFGVTRVFDSNDKGMRMFLHGTTLHGAQALEKEHRLSSITYYDQNGPAGNLFELVGRADGPQAIGAVGLGIGSVACYTRPGRHFDFYEIDPAVQEIAEDDSLFTYLSDCGSPYDIILGDARLKMQKAPDGKYDMIFIDAFSSDNIPIHLITKEAFAMYFDKLTPDGVIVVHISNRYLNLRPLVHVLAEEFGATALFKDQLGGTLEGTDIEFMHAIYSMMSRDEDKIRTLKGEFNWEEYTGPEKKIWTDDFANPLSVMSNPLMLPSGVERKEKEAKDTRTEE